MKEEMSQVQELEAKLEVLQMEYDELLETKTLSLMIGDLVLKSRKSLKSLLKMPFELLNLKQKYVNGEIKPKSSVGRIVLRNEQMLIEKDAVLFMATNGVGLGHLTRCLAVARRMKEHLGTKKIVFLTTCPALHLVRNEGFIPFYVPSKEMFKDNITSSQWDELLSTAFHDLFSLYEFGTIIFDGAIPYQSLAAVLEKNEHITRIWIRRGSAKKGTQTARQKSEDLFDYILTPSEAGDEIPANHEKSIFVEPIVYLNRNELMSKADVRKNFGVSDTQKLIYVQLGAGKINNTENVLNTVINLLLEDKENVIVIGQSPLGDLLNYVHERIIIIKDYPNSKYFKGFDMAISACGYNSFHELLYANVPTVFLPNTNTGTDDQTARALRSEKYGLGIVVDEPKSEKIRKAIQVLRSVAKNIKVDFNFNGSQQASDKILEITKKNLSRLY